MNDSRSGPSSAREARRQAAGHRRAAARLAAGAHRPSQQRLPEMRARRRASGVRADGELPGGRTRQFSVRRERVAEVRRWLDNYQKLKEAIEADLRAQSRPAASEGAASRGGGRRVIEMRRAQLSFGDGLIAEEVSDLREGWMEHADRVLAENRSSRRVRGAGEAASQEPQSWPARGTGRGGAAIADPQARAQLEL